jgi:hypothetical protein
VPLHKAGEAGEWTARVFHGDVRRRGGRESTWWPHVRNVPSLWSGGWGRAGVVVRFGL